MYLCLDLCNIKSSAIMQDNCWCKFSNKIFLESKFKTGTGNMLEKRSQKYIKIHGDKSKI